MPPILKMKNVCKVFKSGQTDLTILNDINLEIAAGESVSIVGASGSGKSTLLNVLAGFDRPTQGNIWYSGVDLNALSENSLAQLWGQKMGFIFQSYRLLPALTAKENVLVPLELARKDRSLEKALEW